MLQRLTARWYTAAAGPSLLQPLSWLYGAAVALRRGAYRRGWLARARIARPVIVIGNITVGGTGKTPLTLWLAERLRASGAAVGILSRGYGRRTGEAREVRADSDWREVGDEPLLLCRRSGCPTVVDADRVRGAQWLVGRGASVVLCDDGLQHLRLAPDGAIVVLDGARGLGNGRLLPAGPLREPASGLADADLLVVNGEPVHPSLQQLASRGALLRMDLEASEALPVSAGGAARPLSAFAGAPVHAVAGIGNPQRFFLDLRARGLTLIEHPFADHHALTAAELAFGDDLPVLMTEKDAVKCEAYADARLWYVPVAARFSEAHARQLLAGVRAKTGDLAVARS
jgi:tetraacyldisaccharide 4'-kinase